MLCWWGTEGACALIGSPLFSLCDWADSSMEDRLRVDTTGICWAVSCPTVVNESRPASPSSVMSWDVFDDGAYPNVCRRNCVSGVGREGSSCALLLRSRKGRVDLSLRMWKTCAVPADPGQLWGSAPCQLTGPESASGLTQPATLSVRQPAWGQNREECNPSPSSLLLLAAAREHAGANIPSVAHYSLPGQWEEAFN